MAGLKWLPEALDDLERLFAFLRERNPSAAARATQTILDGADLLLTSPRLGRPMPDHTQRRELFLPFASSAYVLRYMLEDDDTPVILRVWHSREVREP
jgi:plasmid stabilization system protein ParE